MANNKDSMKALWLKVIEEQGSVTIETGRYKGVMPNTVQAFAKAHGFKFQRTHAEGIRIVSKQ